jgi:hypothetical protein
MHQSAEENGFQQVASAPRPKQDAANCGLGANINPYLDRGCFISVYLAANRNNRGASPRDYRQKVQLQNTPAKDTRQSVGSFAGVF